MLEHLDMWGEELNIGDVVCGIDLTATEVLGCPCVCVYEVIELRENGEVGVRSVGTQCEGRFTKPEKYVSKRNLFKYSPEDLGYDKLCYASTFFRWR